MPPRRPLTAPRCPQAVLDAAAETARQMQAAMVAAAGELAVAVRIDPPLCTTREGGVAGWRLSIAADVVLADVGDATHGKG